MREYEESGQTSDEKPVKVGEEYEVTIESVGAKGDGVCKINNLVIFVKDVQAGETVKIKINDVRDRFAVGEKIE